MPSREAVAFNLQHGTSFTDAEFESRMAVAWPYRLFSLMGGASAPTSVMDGGGLELWMGVMRKAQSVLGTDDKAAINTWAENQFKQLMGLPTVEMPHDQSQLGSTLMGAPNPLGGSVLGGIGGQ